MKQKAIKVQWIDDGIDNNEGFIFGIEYWTGEVCDDVEWFTTLEERDKVFEAFDKL